MKVRVLGAYGAEAPGGRHASAFMLNERTLLDAGSVTTVLSVAEQTAVETVLVSHAHLDHVAGLGYLAEVRALKQLRRAVTVCATTSVLKDLRTSFFNDTVWPNFSLIPSREQPVLRFRSLRDQAENEVDGFRVTPVPVTHTIACSGFIIREHGHALVFSGDTGPTDKLWRAARQRDDVRAVILECSFPNRMSELARVSKHLTPELLLRELDKLPRTARVMIFHIKPVFYNETVKELRRINSERIILLEEGKTYEI